MGDRRARGGDDADHPRRVEGSHLRGQEVVGDEDAGGVAVDRRRQAEQVSEHVVADGANVVGPGSLIGVGELPEPRRQPGHGSSPRLLGGDHLVVDAAHCRSDELVVVEEQQVRGEDVRLDPAGGAGHPVPRRGQLGPRLVDGLEETVTFGLRAGRWRVGGLRRERLVSAPSSGRSRCQETRRPVPIRAPRRRSVSRGLQARQSCGARARRRRRAPHGLAGPRRRRGCDGRRPRRASTAH